MNDKLNSDFNKINNHVPLGKQIELHRTVITSSEVDQNVKKGRFSIHFMAAIKIFNVFITEC